MVKLLLALLCMVVIDSYDNTVSFKSFHSYHSNDEAASKKGAIPKERFSEDSLAKYSYLLIGDYEDRQHHPKGAGCFIKVNNQYYLITAGHVVSSWNAFNFRPKETPLDTFYVRLYSYYDKKPTWLPINIAAIKKQMKRYHFYAVPDLAIIKVNIPSGLEVHSIESMIDNFPYKGMNPTAIYSYGYSEVSATFFRNLLSQQSSSCTFMPYYNLTANALYQNNALDSINYNVNIVKGTASPGFAGAPVFAIYPGAKIVFGGIIEAIDNSNKKAFIIRPKAVTRELNKTAYRPL